MYFSRWYKIENDGVGRILSCVFLCYILEYIYVVQKNKKTHKSCVRFQHVKNDQTFYLIW